MSDLTIIVAFVGSGIPLLLHFYRLAGQNMPRRRNVLFKTYGYDRRYTCAPEWRLFALLWNGHFTV